jgi:hypothetical protein
VSTFPAEYSRQSFLGTDAQKKISRCVVGVVGLGGGGSHIAQQLAHLGFLNIVLFDADTIEPSNLNRLVGGTAQDVKKKTPKTQIAASLITRIRPGATVTAVQDIWQNHAQLLAHCDLVFGCVDGFDQRRQLEAAVRRYLVPLIDIGMDVFRADDGSHAMAGQVILSMPGCPCMTCLGFLNERTHTREAAAYGAAGPQPQVIWANGVLASSAVGIAVDLITDWSRSLRQTVYLSYRGNDGTLTPHARLPFIPAGPCPHYPFSECGVPKLRKL